MGCMVCLPVMSTFDVEGYDAPYVCHDFELTLHSLLLRWKVLGIISNLHTLDGND